MKSKKTSPVLINEVRRQVLDIASGSSEEYDRIDLDRIRKTDEMITRFAVDYFEDNDTKHDHVSSIARKVACKLCETLRWRSDFGINYLKDSDFPIEFYQSGLISLSSVVAGHQVCVMQIDRLVRLKYWSNLWIKFIVHEIEKTFSAVFQREDFLERGQPHFISDSSRSGFAQMNLHFLMTIIPIFFAHFPQGVSKVWLYEVPYFSMALKPIVMRTLPTRIAKKIIFTDRKIFVKDMGYDRVPVTYGGSPANLMTPARADSSEMRSLLEIGRENSIPDHEIEKMSCELHSLIQRHHQSSSRLY